MRTFNVDKIHGSIHYEPSLSGIETRAWVFFVSLLITFEVSKGCWVISTNRPMLKTRHQVQPVQIPEIHGRMNQFVTV